MSDDVARRAASLEQRLAALEDGMTARLAGPRRELGELKVLAEEPAAAEPTRDATPYDLFVVHVLLVAGFLYQRLAGAEATG
jgi:hypothetical protein